jgi:hypothetical protein
MGMMQPTPTLLFVLVAFNGACTGLSQAFVAQMAGIFSRYSFTAGATAWQLMGASFGIALPTFIQAKARAWAHGGGEVLKPFPYTHGCMV